MTPPVQHGTGAGGGRSHKCFRMLWLRPVGLRQGPGWGCRAGRGEAENQEQTHISTLFQPVKVMKITSLEEIFLFSVPIKESGIIDFFLGSSLKDEILKIIPVRKQSCWPVGQIQGVCCCGGLHWSNQSYVLQGGSHCLLRGHRHGRALHCPIAERLLQEQDQQVLPHVTCNLMGRCAAVPHPCLRGTGIVSAPVSESCRRWLLSMTATPLPGAALPGGATSPRPPCATPRPYSYLTPNSWKEIIFTKSPY